jgi:uncharacterized protein (TIGR02145 family)
VRAGQSGGENRLDDEMSGLKISIGAMNSTSPTKMPVPMQILAAVLSIASAALAAPGIVPDSAKAHGHLTDRRDRHVYETTTIGHQTWMAENLKLVVDSSSCNDDDNIVEENARDSVCSEFGRLYNWEAAKVACPKGWHLPSDSEWTVLEKTVGDVGGLRSKTSWNHFMESPFNSWDGTDLYGFHGLPGGFLSGRHDPDGLGNLGYFWSRTAVFKDGTVINGWAYGMHAGFHSFLRNSRDHSDRLSVRCLQN